jgi:hypothetical protein
VYQEGARRGNQQPTSGRSPEARDYAEYWHAPFMTQDAEYAIWATDRPDHANDDSIALGASDTRVYNRNMK